MARNPINYSVTHENDGVFDVFENNTKQVISSHNHHDTAHAMKKFLNLGGAFDGNTPEFFLHTGPVLVK